MKHKQLLLAPLGLIPAAGLSTAQAGDATLPLNAQPVKFEKYGPAWEGWYVGANLGVISARSKGTPFAPGTALNNYCLAFDCTLDASQTATGILGGLQIGYNFQSGRIVYGFETDIALSSAKNNSTTKTGTYNWSANTGVSALGTVRLRLGYTFDKALVYATGGLAYADVRDSYQGDTGYTWTSTGWRAGYTLGGGVEYMVDRNWSVKAEGLYYDLGSKDNVSQNATAAVGIHDHMTGVVGRIGLNYLFH